MEHIARLKRELHRATTEDFETIVAVTRLLEIDAQGLHIAARDGDWNELVGCDFEHVAGRVIRIADAVKRIVERRRVEDLLPRVEEPKFVRT